MKKSIHIVLVLCGLMMFFLAQHVERIRANGLNSHPIQVQNTGFTDSKGTITVAATCPQNYHVQHGEVQISPSSQDQTSTYSIQSNGPNTQRNAWAVTAENKVASTLNITVTVTCIKK